MRARTKPAATLRGLVLALCCALALLLAAGAVRAQGSDAEAFKRWDEVATFAETQVAEESTPTDDLEALRERLVVQRSEIVAVEQRNKPVVDELNQRLQTLGPPPAAGADEAPEVAKLRRDLTQQIAAAQAPVLTAQEAFKRVDGLISSIDRIVRARFSAELMSRAPSPLLPSTWSTAFGDIVASAQRYAVTFERDMDAPDGQPRSSQLPLRLGLVIAGLAISFFVRIRLIQWVERRLVLATSRKSIAWLVTLRNLARLVVPAVGAGLFFAAFDPSGLLVRPDENSFFAIPPFILILIGSSWLAGSLLTPGRRVLGLVPFDPQSARKGKRLIFALGIAVSLSYYFAGLSLRWNLSTTTQGTLQVIPVLLGSLVLWRIAWFAERIRLQVVATQGRDVAQLVTIALRMVFLGVRVVRAVAIVGPILAMLGFLPAAAFLVIRTALTLGLFGAIHTIFDLLNKTAQGLLSSPTAPTAPTVQTTTTTTA